MSNRVLVSYEEVRNPEGPHWVLELERSSNGAPGGLITITHTSVDGRQENQMTIVVEDLRVLQPAIDWAAGVRRG